jgi:hypothetical protein
MSADFYRRVHDHYEKPEVWKYQSREEFLARVKEGQRPLGVRWCVVEPGVAMKVLKGIMADANVTVLTGRRLASVTKSAGRIQSIRCDDDTVFAGRMFIDATYEGDLMAAAGVKYHVAGSPPPHMGNRSPVWCRAPFPPAISSRSISSRMTPAAGCFTAFKGGSEQIAPFGREVLFQLRFVRHDPSRQRYSRSLPATAASVSNRTSIAVGTSGESAAIKVRFGNVIRPTSAPKITAETAHPGTR